MPWNFRRRTENAILRVRARFLHRQHIREVDERIADHDQAIRLNPDDAAAYYNRRFAHKEKGDLDKAEADLKRAMELDPNIRQSFCGE